MKSESTRVSDRSAGADSVRGTLLKIAEMAEAAIDAGNKPVSEEGRRGRGTARLLPGCIIKPLPRRLILKAAETARRVNPVNAPVFGHMAAATDMFNIAEPLFIAVMTSKYWGSTARQLTVSFLESTPVDLRARIISHMNAWTRTGCISFVATSGTGDVRISRGPGGYWSYLGTDILHIPADRPTMNLQEFSMSTPESEYRRVVRHETGHTLGFPHEHMRKALVDRIDPEKAYKWFLETQGWDQATVDAQVLTPLEENSIMGTPADQDSVMCYQLPAEITKDGEPIAGGTDIDQTDYTFCGKIYPKSGRASGAGHILESQEWPESEDVAVSV